MLCLLVFVLTITVINGELSDEIDSVEEVLLGFDVIETVSDEPVKIEGFWKCGNCSDIDESRLVYTEDNDYGDDDQSSAEIEITLEVPHMRCVTVATDKPGVVKKMTGTCGGPAVTLSLHPAGHFTVQVYN